MKKQDAILFAAARCDEITGGHASRMKTYFEILLEKLIEVELYGRETSLWNRKLIVASAVMHDVGKIVTPRAILSKPGKLAAKEFEEMKFHAKTGVEILTQMEKKRSGDGEFFKYAKIIAATHHEKWDGTGYPNGLAGRGVPLAGRLAAIADVYDALVSRRSYKIPFTTREAEIIIENGRGTHFEPALVDVFNAVRGRFAAANKAFDESTYLAAV